ncbi:expressed unknown protein [Seminavis robusta]|uniref:Uncharacterized protein n=1 Tax=Seminavis robusta TaxID=568900 RepID=A0A9N8ERU9_9STRA|nr:expressed unknown protein [Seminavis robusta]|eukprot:Sro1701_g292210.1 n/a (609) ;mRNA; f:16422-18248
MASGFHHAVLAPLRRGACVVVRRLCPCHAPSSAVSLSESCQCRCGFHKHHHKSSQQQPQQEEVEEETTTSTTSTEEETTGSTWIVQEEDNMVMKTTDTSTVSDAEEEQTTSTEEESIGATWMEEKDDSVDMDTSNVASTTSTIDTAFPAGTVARIGAAHQDFGRLLVERIGLLASSSSLPMDVNFNLDPPAVLDAMAVGLFVFVAGALCFFSFLKSKKQTRKTIDIIISQHASSVKREDKTLPMLVESPESTPVKQRPQQQQQQPTEDLLTKSKLLLLLEEANNTIDSLEQQLRVSQQFHHHQNNHNDDPHQQPQQPEPNRAISPETTFTIISTASSSNNIETAIEASKDQDHRKREQAWYQERAALRQTIQSLQQTLQEQQEQLQKEKSNRQTVETELAKQHSHDNDELKQQVAVLKSENEWQTQQLESLQRFRTADHNTFTMLQQNLQAKIMLIQDLQRDRAKEVAMTRWESNIQLERIQHLVHDLSVVLQQQKEQKQVEPESNNSNKQQLHATDVATDDNNDMAEIVALVATQKEQLETAQLNNHLHLERIRKLEDKLARRKQHGDDDDDSDASDIVDDAFADLDAMLSEADKELTDLVGSSSRL